MRKIGELANEQSARTFGDGLFVRGLENNVEAEDDGTFSIWVHDDDQLAQARTLLEEFHANPDAPAWQEAGRKAGRQRKQEERAAEQRSSQVITRERMEYERHTSVLGWGPVVLAILAIAATIFAGDLTLIPSGWLPIDPQDSSELAAQRAAQQKQFELLSITAARPPDTARARAAIEREIARGSRPDSNVVRRLSFDPALPELREGQVWRLFTPIFVHLGMLHLIFNLLWMRDLGSFTQHRFGSLYFWALILSFAAVSNLAQLAWSGPQFGGLSGVNYGLLGFLWMRSKFDRLVVWKMNPQVLQFMIGWYFICLTPFMPGIANAAHTVGLLFGMLTGLLTAKLANSKLLKL
jgi:GlpG protein